MKRTHLAAVGFCALLALSGCGQGSTGIDLLDEPATSVDALPTDINDSVLQPDSARFVAEHEGISYFLAKPASPASATSVCLVAVEPGVIACGGTSQVQAGFAGGEAMSVPDDFDTTRLPEGGWVAVHDNLLLRGSGATP